jgi:hypothetical protein
VSVDARPVARWHDVRATFHDFAVTSFAVEPARLRARLPEDCRPEVVILADGRERALVSAVSFRVHRFRLQAAPWLSAAFNQVNYRTYVRHRGAPTVWFFLSVVSAPWHVGPRVFWQLPWCGALIDITAEWREDGCRRYSLRQRSAGGDAELDATGGPHEPAVPDGFDSREDALRLLTDPLVGGYRRLDGVRVACRVWHSRLDAGVAHAQVARFPVFEDLRLIDRDQAPHSVLLQRSTEFLVRLPPERSPG